jgi:hypothetical protein
MLQLACISPSSQLSFSRRENPKGQLKREKADVQPIIFYTLE